MPKIENWSKTGDYSWQHDDTGFKLKVQQDDIMKDGYNVVGKKPDGPWYEMKAVTRGNVLGRKEDAKKLAVNWMKDNPNL